MQAFDVGTLAGTGSFSCQTCGFTVVLGERDGLPPCPACAGRRFERASLFGQGLAAVAQEISDSPPEWLTEVRDAVAATGDVLAVEIDDTVRAVAIKDGWTRIGRSLAADVRLDDPTVSRRHALVFRDWAGAKVLDDRSLNGVFRNGERVELAELLDGDALTIGRFTLWYLAAPAAVRTDEQGLSAAAR